MSSTETKRLNPLFYVSLLLWIAFSFGLRLLWLDNIRWTYDEGIHALWAQMLARGVEPYKSLFISYPPLYTLQLKWLWQLFGAVEALQIATAALSMLGLLAVGLIAGRLGGARAGLTAAIFLSLEPEFFRLSRGALAEASSLSVSALAIAFAAFYLWGRKEQRGWRWLVASGVTLAASLMLKILSPFVLALIPLMILARQAKIHPNWQNARSNALRWNAFRDALRDGAIWAAALILPIIALSLFFDLPSLYRQVIEFRFVTRGAYTGEVNNLLFMLDFLARNWIVSLLAIFGLVWTGSCRLKQGWFVLAWMLLAVIFALMQVPLRDKHLPLLLLPLSVLAGVGFAWLLRLLKSLWHFWHLAGLAAYAVLLIAAALYFRQIGQSFSQYQRYQQHFLSEDNQKLADYLAKFTSPTDCIITDDPTLAFVARRQTPPNLAEASSARLRSGNLTAQILIKTAQQSDCQIVAPTAKRFYRSAPEFVEWAKGAYRALWLHDGATEILLAKPIVNLQPAQPLDIDFNHQIKLVGYDLSPVEEGQAYLSLYWQPITPLERDYTIFVQVRDAAGNTLINADHQPYNGLLPTSRWHAGEVIKETIRLDAPPDMPAGDYQIYAGMYLRQNNQFVGLPIIADTSGENAVIISNFIIP